MRASADFRGTSFAVAAAASTATLGILLKFAFAAGANITTIISVRFILAAPLLFLVIRKAGRPIQLAWRQTLTMCAIGVIGYGGMSVLFANGLRFLSASMAGMLFYTYPAIVTLLAFLIREERPDRRKGLALLVCLAGLYLVLGVSRGSQIAGIVSILGAAFLYSICILVSNHLLKSLDPLVAAFYICTSTGIGFLLYGWATHRLVFALPAAGWLAILAISLLPTFIGIVCFLKGVRLIGASRASIICTVEPFLTVIFSFILLRERMSVLQLAGGVLIITGLVLPRMTLLTPHGGCA